MYSTVEKLLSFRLENKTFFKFCLKWLISLLLLKTLFFTNYCWAFEVSIETRSGSLFYDQLAVQDALNTFFEPQKEIISSGPLKKEDFSARIEESFDVKVVSQVSEEPLGISFFARNSLYGNFFSELSLSYLSGNSKYYFPEGLKPFIDPISLDIKHEELDIRVAAGFQRRINRYVTGNMKFGVSRSTGRVRSKVLSELLDIQTSETHLGYSTFFDIGLSIGYKFKVSPSFVVSQYSNKKLDSQLVTKLSYEF